MPSPAVTKPKIITERKRGPIVAATTADLAKLAPAEKVFGASIEGAQHGGRKYIEFLDAIQAAGARHVQPSNYQLHAPHNQGWKLRKPEEIVGPATDRGMLVGGSAHCPIYMITGGLQVYPGETAPFYHPSFQRLGSSLRRLGAAKLQKEYLPRLFDFYAEAGVKVIAMFWGPLFDPEGIKKHGAASGNLDSRYGWPFLTPDQLDRALEIFAKLALPILEMARKRGLVLAHELHPKTAAWTPDEWALVKKAVGNHPSFKINADPSHCWNGLTPRQTFTDPAVKDDIVLAHFKDHKIIPGKPLLTFISEWQKRGMQFCPLGEGDLDLQDFATILMEIGAVARYRKITGHPFFPATGEAEAVYQDGLDTALHGIRWLAKNICWFTAAEGSFEDGMGDKKKGDKK